MTKLLHWCLPPWKSFASCYKETQLASAVKNWPLSYKLCSVYCFYIVVSCFLFLHSMVYIVSCNSGWNSFHEKSLLLFKWVDESHIHLLCIFVRIQLYIHVNLSLINIEFAFAFELFFFCTPHITLSFIRTCSSD